MKTLLSIFLQLCVLSSVFVKTADAQRRGVVWVHGLNSNSSEWSNWDNIFSAERQINTLNRSSYNTDVGVQNMANQVAGNYGADNRNIYFGHSMGGVVGRDIDVRFNNCMNQYAGTQATYQQYITCQNQNTHQNCYTYYASVNGQSDAFIKSPSQTGYNSNWSSGASTIEARGVNHLEMKKHPRMRDIYNEIFNGNHGGFFQTPQSYDEICVYSLLTGTGRLLMP